MKIRLDTDRVRRAIPDEVLAEIADAFPPVPLTAALFGDTTLWKDYVDIEAFEANRRDRSWDMLERDFVEFHYNALGYMTPEAFAAVLPAYLVAFGQDTETWSSIPTFLLSELTREEGWEETFDARVAVLTDQQRIVILRVLEAVAHSKLYPFHKAELAAALDSWREVLSNLAP